MKSFRAICAALITLCVAMTGPAAAMPQAAAPAVSGDLVVRVQVDCHDSVRQHYLPRYDRRVWHRHRQSDCRVIIVDREDDDDYGDRPRDCHRDVRRHYLRQYGSEVTHKHIGDSCRVKIYRQYPGGQAAVAAPAFGWGSSPTAKIEQQPSLLKNRRRRLRMAPPIGFVADESFRLPAALK